MSSFKYSRLPTADATPQFNSLDGPSYFTYGVEHTKYKSAFTYSNMGPEPVQEELPELPRSSVLCTLCSILVTFLCYLGFILTLPISAWWTIKNVQHYERIVLFRLGRLSSALGPGYVVVLPCIDRWVKVDLRMKAFSVPPQKVISGDSAVLEVGADVYFRVKDAIMSVTNVQDLNHSTRIICQTLLQKIIGKRSLADIESDRFNIANSLQVDVNQMTQTWGVEVSRVELSMVKVHSQPNPLFASGTSNPLSVLGPVLFPPGNSNAPVEQLKHFYHLGSPTSDRSSAQGSGFSDIPVCRVAMKSPSDMISVIRPFLNRSLVQDFGHIYKFIVTDEDGVTSQYYLDLKNGEGRADFGEPPGGADVTLTLPMGVLRELLVERLSAFDAYMTGRLTVSGDLKAAMRLGPLFEGLNRSLSK